MAYWRLSVAYSPPSQQGQHDAAVSSLGRRADAVAGTTLRRWREGCARLYTR